MRAPVTRALGPQPVRVRVPVRVPALLLLLLLGLALPLGSAWAATPVLSVVYPRGGARGTEVKLQLYGARMADARALLFDREGLSTVSVTVADKRRGGQRVEAVVRIAADAPLGEHGVRLITRSGISELRTFWVSATPHVGEKEPNNVRAQAMPVPLGRTVRGRLMPEDVDWFAVALEQGQRLTAELFGVRLASNERRWFDPHLALYDGDGRELVAVDDTTLHGADPTLAFVAPRKGTYYVRLREAAYRGNDNAFYHLHLSTAPRPLVAYPAGGPGDQPLPVTLLGDPKGPLKLVATPPGDAETTAVWCGDAGGTVPSPVRLASSPRPNAMEKEPNDGPKQATPAHPLQVIPNGRIDKPDDSDWWAFEAPKGYVVDVRLVARDLGSPLDGILTIHRADGRYLAGNDDQRGGELDARLRYRVPDKGTYYLRVADHRRRGGPTFVYRIEPWIDRPEVRVAIPPFGRNSQAMWTAPVPRGNRYVALLNAERWGVGGDLRLLASDLPPGVRVDIPTVPNGLTLTPALFEAAADAPLEQSWAALRVLGRQRRGQAEVTAPVAGGLRQVVPLLIGPPNNSLYHTRLQTRLAVATTEAVPFRVELVAPKTPLLQGGARTLLVRVQREQGFKGNVVVRMLYNPPGVSSRRQLVIDGKTAEARLQLTARGNARVGRYPIALLCYAGYRGGPIHVGSNLVELEVAPPLADVALTRVATVRGQAARMGGTLVVKRPFVGKATVKLLGLPGGLKAAPLTVDVGAPGKPAPAGTKLPLQFVVPTKPDMRPGRYRGVFAQVLLPGADAPLLHVRLGQGELRVDAAPPGGPKAKPKQQPKQPKQPKGPPPKRPLTRLEKLRLEQERRQQAQQQPKAEKP